MTATTYGQSTYGAERWGYAAGATDGNAHFVIEAQFKGEWLDLTCDVRSIRIHLGRSSQLDSFAAGTLTLDLADFQDRYNAWNPSGLWSLNGAFRTGVPIRVHVVQAGIARPLFSGTTDSVQDSWPGTVDALTRVEASDAFKLMARGRPTKLGAAVGAAELSGARVDRILTAAGYTGARALDTGLSAWQGTILDGISLDLLDEVREGEYGALYVDSDGTMTFRARDAVTANPRMANVQFRFLDYDDNAALTDWTCYSDLTLEATDDQVINQANVTRTGGALQTSADAASIAWYDVRSWSRTGIALNADADALQLALALVANGKDNDRRIDAISFNPLRQTNGQHVAANVRLLDRIRVIRHAAGGTQIDAELLVQGITHDIAGTGLGDEAGAWTVTLSTSNARLIRDAAQWDVGGWDQGKWGV